MLLTKSRPEIRDPGFINHFLFPDRIQILHWPTEITRQLFFRKFPDEKGDTAVCRFMNFTLSTFKFGYLIMLSYVSKQNVKHFFFFSEQNLL